MSKKIAFACDHRGVKFRPQILDYLKKNGYEVSDFGTFSEDPVDYPDYIFQAAEAVSKGTCPYGIAVCHSGIGSTIAANKVPGVRAAPAQSVEEAELSRGHNDANMLILGSGFLKPERLIPVVKTWLNTPFEGGRHGRRVNKIKDYERKHLV